MYAFVDVEQYQIVGTGQTIDEAKRNYRQALNLEDTEIALESNQEPVTGTINEIIDVVVSGNTVYYFTLTGDENIYTASITSNEKLPFIKPGDTVTFTYSSAVSPSQVIEWK